MLSKLSSASLRFHLKFVHLYRYYAQTVCDFSLSWMLRSSSFVLVLPRFHFSFSQFACLDKLVVRIYQRGSFHIMEWDEFNTAATTVLRKELHWPLTMDYALVAYLTSHSNVQYLLSATCHVPHLSKKCQNMSRVPQMIYL